MKRMLALMLCLLLGSTALAETYVVDYFAPEDAVDYALLIRDDGTPLTPPETYSSIYMLTPEDTPEADRRYCVNSLEFQANLDPADIDELDYDDYHRVALMDGEGKLLTGYDFTDITRVSDEYYTFNAPEPVYDGDDVPSDPGLSDLHFLGDGRWLAMRMIKPEGWENMTPARRMEVLTERASNGDDMYETVILEADGSVTKTGINSYSQYLPSYYYSTGAMDAQGHVVIEPQYAALQPFGDGSWLALRWALIPRELDPKDEWDTLDALFDVLILSPDGAERETGLRTTNSYLPSITEGFATVYQVEEYGSQAVFLDSDGKVCFGRGFEDNDPFDGTLAKVEVDELYGLIDQSGDFAAEPGFDYIEYVDFGEKQLYFGRKGSTLTAMDAETGEELWQEDFSPSEYVGWTAAGPDLLWVSSDNTYYYYSLDGQRLAAYPESEAAYYGWTPCTPDELRVLESVGEWPGSTTRLVDDQGSVIGRTDCQNLYEGYTDGTHVRYIFNTCRIVRNSEGELWPDYNSYRYGIMDETGAELLPPVYDRAVPLSLDRYWVSTGNTAGLIDAQGNWYYTINDFEYLMD